jgi:hypothetical protein
MVECGKKRFIAWTSSILSISRGKEGSMRNSRRRALGAAFGALLQAFASSFFLQETRAENGAWQVPATKAVQSPENSSQHDMEHHGEDVMGFSQTKTAHHFLLTKDGGVIAVSAKDPQDTVSQDQIRMHLPHIATAFASGDFTDPMEVHEQTPPGVSTMKRLKAQIQYKFEEIDTGGRVLIHSDNTKAIDALHDFLRFQIREHHTGDSLKVK